MGRVVYIKYSVLSLVAANCLTDIFPEIPLVDIGLPASNIVVKDTTYLITVPIVHDHSFFLATGGTGYFSYPNCVL